MIDYIETITDFVFMETPISRADLILIPGGSYPKLMEKAALLYHEGFALKVLPSGGANHRVDTSSEWEFLRRTGIELGIPEEAILKEDRAKHTIENAELSWNVIKSLGIPVNKAIIVCKAFHARRAYMTYRLIFPDQIEFMVAPVVDIRDIRKDNWFTSDEKIRKVMSEVEKIGKYFSRLILSL
ncbi:MAG: YdcF family protein [Candidatus Aegiribacteria sp.]|nr:YdcF family protein [Candidatus Aegiribacteria sp.]